MSTLESLRNVTEISGMQNQAPSGIEVDIFRQTMVSTLQTRIDLSCKKGCTKSG